MPVMRLSTDYESASVFNAEDAATHITMLRNRAPDVIFSMKTSRDVKDHFVIEWEQKCISL